MSPAHPDNVKMISAARIAGREARGCPFIACVIKGVAPMIPDRTGRPDSGVCGASGGCTKRRNPSCHGPPGADERNVMRLNRLLLALCAIANVATADELADSASLDPTFGNAGKVMLGATAGYASPVAYDVAAQADGKLIVVGYETVSEDGDEAWRITRLDAQGNIDASFGTGGTVHYNAGVTGTRAQAVAIRPDGRIVVGGNYLQGAADSVIEVAQFTPSGVPDSNFAGGQGYLLIYPAAGDSNTLSRLLIES